MHKTAVFGVLAIFISGCAVSDNEYRNSKSEYYQLAKSYVDFAALANAELYSGWQCYGDWQVKLVSDEMSATSHVKMFTVIDGPSTKNSDSANEIMSFGLQIFGGELIIVSSPSGLSGEDYWPICNTNSSTISIDGAKAAVLNDRPISGGCDAVDPNGVTFKSLLAGKKAKVHVGDVSGGISLDGFKEAWSEGLKLAK